MLVKCTPSASGRGWNCLPNKQSANFKTKRLQLMQPTLFDQMKHFLFGKIPLLILFAFGVQNSSFGQCTNPDNEAPDAVCIAFLQASLDGSGQVFIDPNEIDNGSTDNCGVETISVNPEILNCTHVGSTQTITLTVMDAAGNTNSCTTDVDVVENVDPIITCPADVTVNCPGSTTPPDTGVATATDNCGLFDPGTPAGFTGPINTFYYYMDSSSPSANPGECNVISRTWRVHDVSGNFSECTQIINLNDNQDPTLDFNAGLAGNQSAAFLNQTINCEDAIPVAASPTSADNCGAAPITFNEVDTQGGDPTMCDFYDYTITRTYTATDACGNTTTDSYVVTVEDVEAPDFTGSPMTLNVSSGAACSAFVTLDLTGIPDNCATPGPNNYLTTSYAIVDANGSTVDVGNHLNASGTRDVGVYNYNFTAVDPCGNVGTHTVVVTVADNVAPTPVCFALIQVSVPPTGFADITAEMLNDNSNDNCPGDLTFEVDRLGVMPARVFCADVGTTVTDEFSLTVTDASGNTASCMSDIQVVDNSPPAMFCQDITIELDAGGNATITAADVDAGSNDACGPFTLSATPTAFDCTDVGANTVTLTGTDGAGNMNTCTSQVTVEDNMPPVASCTDITVDLNSNGTYTLTTTGIGNDVDNMAAGSSDNCSFTASVSPSTFDCSDIGANPVVLTVTDPSGNSDTDGDVIMDCIVTVQDVTDPNAICADFIAKVDEDCEVVVNASDFDNGSTDNCGPLTFTFNATGLTTQNYVGIQGPLSVDIDVEDPSGNTSTCTVNLDVIDDKAPTAICHSGLTIALDGNGVVTLPASVINAGSYDNCDNDPDLAISPNSFDCTNLLTNPNIVTLTVTDDSGNAATCTTPVTIQDNTGPSLWCPDDITIDCSDSTDPSNTGQATAMDNCDGVVTPTFTDVSLASGGFNDDDCRIIRRTWSATDNTGNTSTCTQDITVEDNADPVFTLPHPLDETVECTPDADPEPPVTDNCDESINVNLTQTSTQGIDPTMCSFYNYTLTRVWTATDNCGNTSSVDKVITVQDTQGPVFGSPMTLDPIPNDAGSCAAFVEIQPPVTDCADSIHLTITNDAMAQFGAGYGDGMANASGNYNVGTYTINFTGTDPCGNVTNFPITFTVFDTETPSPACIGPSIISLNSSGNAPITVSMIDNGSSDNCGIQSMTVNPSNFDCAHANTTQSVTLTVTDLSGQSNSCTTSVTIQENSPPTIVCPDDVTIECSESLDPDVNSNLGMPTVSTFCMNNIQPTFQDQTIVGGSNPDCRTIQRTWTATNASGSATCTQIIVVEDNEDPVLAGVPIDETVDCSMIPDPADVTATDNCAMPPAVNFVETSTQNPDPTLCGHYEYELTRTWTAVDNCGRTDVGVQELDVEDDNAPVFSFPMPLIIGNDPDECFATVNIFLGDYISDCAEFQYLDITNDAQTMYGNGNATDNVNGQYAVGDYPIMVTATDPCGNTSMTTFTLSIRDMETPNAVCDPEDILVLDNNGNGVITPADIDEGSSDNCTNISLSLSQTMFTSADVGVVTVTLTVTDDAGNTSSCNSELTIVDRPTLTIGNVSGQMGTTVNVPVVASNFDDICAIQATFTVDDALVGLVTGVSNFNLDGLAATDFNISGNTITIDWIDPDGSGEDISSASIFTIDVNLVGNNGDMSPVSIDTNPSNFVIGRCVSGGIVGVASTGVDGSINITSNPMMFNISGRIADASNSSIALANIIMTGSASSMQTTDNTGQFDFDVSGNNTVNIKPEKDVNPKNGVDVIDVLFIKAHDLNQAPLTDPYKLIAADVNNDGDVNVLDRFLVHAMNINMLAAFPNSPAWKFVESSYVFSADPLNDPYPQSADFVNVSADEINVDFVGVKMGDVSGSANPLLAVGNNTGTIFNTVNDRADDLNFLLEDKTLQAGTVISVPFKAKDFINQMAYQFTLEFDPTVLAYQSAIPGVLPELSSEHFGTNDLAEGLLPAQWYDFNATTIADNEVLFTLTFEVLADAANLSDLLAIVDYPTPSAAFDDALEASGVDLTFANPTSVSGVVETPVLLANQPNPFSEETQISFSLPQAAPANLTITDVSGKVIKTINGFYNTGLQTIILKGNDFPAAGIYFYQLNTEWGTLTQKMIVKK